MSNEMARATEKTETAWVIEPRSPLVLRTGRVGINGTGKVSFDFPMPGTIAGATRAAFADANNWDFEVRGHRALVEAIEVHGPLLARQNVEKGALELFFPKPADAVYLQDRARGSAWVYTAYPVEPAAGEGCDLPHSGLLPVVLDAEVLAKPVDGPAFWDEQTMTRWLLGDEFASNPDQCGQSAPPNAVRTHVQMNRERRAHEDEGLFESGGPDFAPRAIRTSRDGCAAGWDYWQYAMLVHTGSVGLAETIEGAVRRIGADGRTAYFTGSNAWPRIPNDLARGLDGLRPGSVFRLVLATPAVFSAGWIPGWLNESDLTSRKGLVPEAPGLRLRLVAAACDRWQAYSGWNMEKGGPRAIRRLVSAGAVYWFELIKGSGADIAKLWLQPISDSQAARRDGFGLALPGLCRGKPGN